MSFVFDDTILPPTKQVLTTDPNTDTSAFGNLRQGIDLKNMSQLYGSSQPKVWGGQVDSFGVISHEQNFNTIGDVTPFTDFFGSVAQEDLPKFDIVSYLTFGSDYRFPIWLNGGPQRQQEAAIEPLPIVFKLPSAEGVKQTRGVHASWDSENEQFITGESVMPFLDEGEEKFGDSYEGAVLVSGFASNDPTYQSAFEDTTQEANYINFFTNLSQPFVDAYAAMSGSNMSFGLTPPFSSRGNSCYGPNAARYRTDSFAFVGLLRGS